MATQVRRYAVSPRRRRRTPESLDAKSQSQFWKLLICLCLFGVMLLMRFLSPEGTHAMRETIARTVGGGVDVERAMSDLGRALSSGEPFSGAVRVFSEHLFSGQPQETVSEDPEALPSPAADAEQNAASPEPQASVTWPDAMRQDAMLQDAMRPTSHDRQGQTPPAIFAQQLSQRERIGSGASSDRQEKGPVVMSPWEAPLQSADTQDDTWPLPFGMPKPEKVDFTSYDMNFDHTLPSDGEITSTFGYRIHPIDGEYRFHYGVDFGAAEGEPIAAFAEGTVSVVGHNNTYGNYVIIKHADGFATMYGHCQKIFAKEGQTVKLGQRIAAIGNTGLSTGPHLHFEVHRNEMLLDPLGYLTI